MKKGVLLINLGSPESFARKDIKRYLRQFLSDKYVISLPFFARWLLVNGIIVPFRSSHTARLYRSVWTSKGAPLLVYSQSFLEKIRNGLKTLNINIPVELSMRYGHPSIQSALEHLFKEGIDTLLVVPLYPHYAQATYESALAELKNALSHYPQKISLQIIPPFYEHGDYLSALERTFREKVTGHSIDQLVFSFHGVPLTHLPCSLETAESCNEDAESYVGHCESCPTCYRYQCYRTAELLVSRIGGDKNNYTIAFQSKMGKGKWLKPYLIKVLSDLPKQGIRHIAVIAPSFTADCLETLYELDVESKALFLSSGGIEFLRVPCLNDQDLWVKKMVKWIREWDEKND